MQQESKLLLPVKLKAANTNKSPLLDANDKGAKLRPKSLLGGPDSYSRTRLGRAAVVDTNRTQSVVRGANRTPNIAADNKRY